MAHAVSALYSKFNRMSPTAAAMAALLHAFVALAFLLDLPRRDAVHTEQAIEFTVDVPTPSTPETAAAPPPPAAPAAQAPTPSSSPPPRLGLAPPRSLTPDPTARPAAPEPTPAEAPKPTTEPAPPPPATPEPAQQQAAVAPPPPPPPPPPTLEQALPPLEAPPPPVAARDLPRPAPAPPATPPPPRPAPTAQTPPPQQRLQSSPLSRPPQQRPAESHATAQPPPSPLTNPASQYGQRKAQDDYLWQVMRKISLYHYTPKSSIVSEEGVVVMRLTIARDGRLLDVSLARSSGFPNLDNGVMETIRQASPFAPLPTELPGDRHTFILPVNYAYKGAR